MGRILSAAAKLRVSRRAGHQVVTLVSGSVEADVLPGKGGDIVSIRRRHDGLPLLFATPWGLRPQWTNSAAAGSEGRLMESYPGGWQTVFPNGGDAAECQNTTWGMHGEVWLTAFEWEPGVESASIAMCAELVHSPFRIDKEVVVDGSTVAVTESITHRGGHPVDVMWSHHPAFGAPFLSADCVLDTDASGVVVDDETPPGNTDIRLGATGRWPYVPDADGGVVDLRRVPAGDAGVSRMAYLTGFSAGRAALRNPRLDAGVLLEWDHSLMPYTWYWLEAAGTPGFPWCQGTYVLGIEPATSIPGHGINAAIAAGTALTVLPGERKTATVRLTVTDGGGDVATGKAEDR